MVKMKQKKIVSMIGMLILLISVIFVTGCSTVRPVGTTAQFPADGNKYVILGRVEYQGKLSSSGAGYTKLLEVAKEKYPNADDVVNIVMDAKYTKGLFGGATIDYIIISGVAIDYLEVK
jgi:lipoprotein